MNEKVTLPGVYELTSTENKIFYLRFLPKSTVTLEHAKDVVEKMNQMGKDYKYTCNLVDIREMTYMDSSARKHFAEQRHERLQAVAILINSKIQSALANMYFKFAKPEKETKMFDKLEDAEAWLNGILAKKYGSKS